MSYANGVLLGGIDDEIANLMLRAVGSDSVRLVANDDFAACSV
jgi:hypothetical protein